MRPNLGRILGVILLLCGMSVASAWGSPVANLTAAMPALQPGFALSTLVEGIQNPVALVNTGPHLFGIDPATGSVFRVTLAGATVTTISTQDDLKNAYGLALGLDASLFVSVQAQGSREDRPGVRQSETPAAIKQLSGAGILQSIVVTGSPLVEPMGAALAPKYFGVFAGQLIVADGSGTIWAVQPKQHRVSLLGISKGLDHPIDVTFDVNDTLLVADATNGILRVLPTGEVSSIANLNNLGGTPVAVAVHRCTGDLYVAVESSTRQAVVKIDKRTQAVSVFASGFGNLGGTAGVGGLEFSPDGSRLFISDPGTHRIYQALGFSRCNRAITLLRPTMSASAVGSNILQPNGVIEYSVSLYNEGNTQSDNPGNELEIPVPAHTSFIFGTLSATSGFARFNPVSNRVEWNGGLLPAGRVTVTFRVQLDGTLPTGKTVANQGYAFFDQNGDGTNEASILSDDAGTPGHGAATVLTVISKGDLDGDGRVTLYDINLLHRFFKKIEPLTPAQLAAADVALPCGKINTRDLARLTVTAQFGRPLQSDCDNAFSRYDIMPDVASTVTSGRAKHAQQFKFLEFALPPTQTGNLNVYETSGRLVYSSGWTGDLIVWAPLALAQPRFGNGVYLYVLTIRDSRGLTVQRAGKFVLVK